MQWQWLLYVCISIAIEIEEQTGEKSIVPIKL